MIKTLIRKGGRKKHSKKPRNLLIALFKEETVRRRSATFTFAMIISLLIASCSMVGEIEVTSTPKGADVYIDDSLTDALTDCVLIDVPTGAHTIKVVLGDKEYTEEVTVKNGATSTVNADLAAKEEDLLWKYEATAWIRNCPAIADNGMLYLTSEDGMLIALAPSGRFVWQQQIGILKVTAPVVGADGNVYVGSDSVILACFDPSGSLLWQYKDTITDFRVTASPIIDDNNRIYVLTNNGILYVFASDGTLDTTYATNHSLEYTSPALSGETMYCGLSNGLVLAVTTSGTIKWQRTFQQGFFTSPAITESGLICIGNTSTVLSVFVALNPDSSTNWSVSPTGGTRSSAAIGPDGTAYFSTTYGHIYAVGSNGAVKWTYVKSGGDLESSPVVGADGTVYIGVVSPEGKYIISALDPADGKPIWEYNVSDPVFHSTISPSGVLYTASGKYLYAFYIGQSIADSPWPKFRNDIKNSGRAGS